MPYIEEKDRPQYDEAIDALLETIPRDERLPGHLNHIVSRLSWALLGEKPAYARCNEVMGALICAALETYRRKVAKAEDKKIEENGDLPVRQPLNDRFANYTDVDDDPPDKPAAPHSQHNPKVADTTAGGTDPSIIPCHYYYGGQQFVSVETSNIKWLYLHRPIVNSDGTKCWMVYTSDKRELEKREANATAGGTNLNIISCHYYCDGWRYFVGVEASNIKNAESENAGVERRLYLHWPILNPTGGQHWMVYTFDRRESFDG